MDRTEGCVRDRLLSLLATLCSAPVFRASPTRHSCTLVVGCLVLVVSAAAVAPHSPQ